MKFSVKPLAGILGTVGVLAFAATAHAAATGLAFSPLSLDIPALKGLSEGVKHVGADKGYDVVILDPKYDAPTQAQQLNQLIETGRIKAAWAIAVNPGAMGGVIETAQKNGAVLVLNGVPADYGFKGMTAGVTFANIDYAAFGGTAGKLGGQCANADLGGKGSALLIESKEGTAGKADIDAAMEKQLLATSPGSKIVETIITSERAESLTKVSQVLQAHPEINVVVSAHDEGALGAYGAFQAAGKKVTCIVASGGTKEVLDLIGKGQMYGASALNFGGDMMQTFDAIAMMLKDPKANGRQQSVPIDVKVRP